MRDGRKVMSHFSTQLDSELGKEKVGRGWSAAGNDSNRRLACIVDCYSSVLGQSAMWLTMDKNKNLFI